MAYHPLLTDSQLAESIASKTNRARADYERSRKELKVVLEALSQLSNFLNSRLNKVAHSHTSKEAHDVHTAVVEHLDEVYQRLEENRVTDLKYLENALREKRRSLNHFTLTMMGRTKAGKSTLFATLLDNEYERIGKGKQRKNRQNHAYDLPNNIRLIDTPGIAAVGGEEDTQEALKAVGESDLICYVITNDSIQVSEFEFLSQLKNQSKPLIILLNVQYNLIDKRRLSIFLKNPDKHLTGDSVDGHKQRLLKLVREHYHNSSVRIFPVMLLAVQLSQQEEDSELRQKLYEASHIESFLSHIGNTIENYGSLLASQMLLGEMALLLVQLDKPIKYEINFCQDIIEKFTSRGQELERRLVHIRRETLKQVEVEIESIFQELIDYLPTFARKVWDWNPNDQSTRWSDEIKTKFKTEEKLKNTLNNIENRYKKKVNEALTEFNHDISSFIDYKQQEINFSGIKAEFDFNFLLGMLATFAAVAGIAIGGVAGFPAIAVIAVPMLVNRVQLFFPDKKGRQQQTCQQIESQLKENLQECKKKCLHEYREKFDLAGWKLETKTQNYFEDVIEELEHVSMQLKNVHNAMSQAQGQLCGFFALRIFDWCNNDKRALSKRRLNATIAHITRKPSFYFRIYLKTNILPPQLMQEQCSQMLGETISFIAYSEHNYS